MLEQGYTNLEYMVVDGGSTDGTVDMIRRYEERLAWWVPEPDKGQTDAINKGIERPAERSSPTSTPTTITFRGV